MQSLLWVAGLSMFVRLWIGATFPITGDEAFFYWWGVYPDWGYYDHPPMVGWLIHAMLVLFGDSTFTIRLPVIVLPLLLGAAMWWAFSPVDRTRTAWAILLFWLAPLNWLNTLITTDTPLIFWSVLSVGTLYRAEQRASQDGRTLALYALAGLFLAGAFLSKYFSVVLGLAFMSHFLIHRRERWKGYLLLVLVACIGPAINLGWNMGHGWSNIMFNVYNRNEDAHFAAHKPALYLLTWAYLLTPAVLWFGWKFRRELMQACRSHRLLAHIVGVSLLFFALLSFKKVVGLHWVLSFYPVFFVLLAFAVPVDRLMGCAKGVGAFLAVHLVVVAGLYGTEVSDWKNTRLHQEVVRSYRTAELMAKVSAPGVVLMGAAYTPAAIYGHTIKQYVPVFGRGKFHARQDDLLVDFSQFDGKTVRIVGFSVPSEDEARPYFDSVQLLRFEQDDLTFYALEGRGFKYDAYRREVLGDIFRRYYNIPKWLPMSGCPFCERYCGAVRCTAGQP